MKPLLSSEKLIPPQPLTKPVPARAGKRVVTPDWLLSLPNRTEDYPTIMWLNNSKIIYASPPSVHKKGWTLELVDVVTNQHTVLGKGLLPKASPDGNHIAFIKGEKETRQLWLMDNKGKNLRQLTHIKDGLSNDYFFEFCWSPDSKQLALSHKPYIEHWEKKQQPKSTIYLIDIASGKMKEITTSVRLKTK